MWNRPQFYDTRKFNQTFRNLLQVNYFFHYDIRFSKITFDGIFSSPEPKAHCDLIVYQSIRRLCVCLCVNIFKHEYLRNQPVDRLQPNFI